MQTFFRLKDLHKNSIIVLNTFFGAYGMRKFTIKNYKSIVDLTLDIGRMNIFIGENGSGKTNILEAFAFAGLGMKNYLHNEIYPNRGINVTSSKLMINNFKGIKSPNNIHFVMDSIELSLCHDGSPWNNWKVLKKTYEYSPIKEFVVFLPELKNLRKIQTSCWSNYSPLISKGEMDLRYIFETQPELLKSLLMYLQKYFNWVSDLKFEYLSYEGTKLYIKDIHIEPYLDQSQLPESVLRVIFYYLVMHLKSMPKMFAFDNIDIGLNPKLCRHLIKDLCDFSKTQDKQIFITISNPGILDGINLGDDEQRIFIVSREDDIGYTQVRQLSAKNKPCSSIIGTLNRILLDGKMYSKQDVLNNFEQSDEPLKLSEAFLRGYIGGLPKTF